MLRDPSLVPLSHQHHNALSLCVLAARSLASDGSLENVKRQARRILERYDLEIVNHFEIEEGVLFPAVPGDPIVERLIGEHRILGRPAENLRAEPARAVIDEFLTLLRTHIRTEENELFERAQAVLSREALEALGREIDRKAVRICL